MLGYLKNVINILERGWKEVDGVGMTNSSISIPYVYVYIRTLNEGKNYLSMRGAAEAEGSRE